MGKSQWAGGQGGAQAIAICALVYEATLFQQVEQIGNFVGHYSLPGGGKKPEGDCPSFVQSASGGLGARASLPP